jgi:uncharacterized protein
MIIDLRTISDSYQSYEIELEKDWWRPDGPNDQVHAFDQPLQVRLGIYRAGDRYVLEGRLSGGVLASCDRCVEPYHLDLKSDFKVFLTLPLSDSDEAEIELLEEDMEVDFIKGEEVDVDEVIREQIYLSLPMKSLCGESCLGLCPICGGNLNKGKCRCQREYGHPAFSKLKNLKIEGD